MTVSNKKFDYNKYLRQCKRHNYLFSEYHKREPINLKPRILLPSTKIFPTSAGCYVSKDGGGSGKYPNEPISYDELKRLKLKSGDRLYFKRDEIVDNHQLDIENIDNVSVSAYGTGANPIVTGSSYIGGQTWVDNGDGNWYTSLATEPLWVTEDDVLLRLAESNFIPITLSVSTTVKRVNAATINALPNSIVGAKLIAKEYSFRATERATVTAYDSGTGNITFTPAITGAAVGMPILLSNQSQFVTTAGDWFYDAALDRIYIKSATNPSGRNIRVITHEVGITISNSSGCSIDGIDFKHYLKYGLLITNSPSTVIQNGDIHSNRGDGIRTYGNSTTNLTIDNVNIYNCGLRGIEIGGIQTASLTNMTVHDIGTQANLGYPFDQNHTGGTGITIMVEPVSSVKVPNNVTIDHCDIYNVGYQGIQAWGNNHQITNNKIHNYCLKWSDGGAVHLYYTNVLSSSTSNVLTEHNIIYDGVGNVSGITSGAVDHVIGVYHDNGINNCTTRNNVIYNPGDFGIFCNTFSTGHTLINNLITGAETAQIQIRQDSAGNPNFPYSLCQNCVMTGNVMAAPIATARCFSLWNINNSSTFNPFTTVNTNHYVQPYGTPVNNRTQNNSTYTDMTLAQWQTYIGSEGSATGRTNYKVTPDSDDILVETNNTDSPVNFNTPGGYSDYNAGSFTNPVSIPAHYGLIYFQN